jgi:hypothetical protein
MMVAAAAKRRRQPPQFDPPTSCNDMRLLVGRRTSLRSGVGCECLGGLNYYFLMEHRYRGSVFVVSATANEARAQFDDGYEFTIYLRDVDIFLPPPR